jgi:indole-3-glycerol phosphate synthase
MSTSVANVLEAIVAAARRRVEVREAAAPRARLERLAAARVPRGEAFLEALRGPGLNIIAECKRRSPSRGVLRHHYDPVSIAMGYARAGAAAISVLTEPTFFDGGLDHLEAVREAVATPLLRKDFVVTEYQVVEARAAGADAVLLIAGVLPDDALAGLLRCAEAHELAALVEVHEEPELQRALACGASLIGVNARDLRSLAVDLDVAASLVDRIPEGCVAVAESGLRSAADVARFREAGYDAFLVGEHLMRAPDPGAALAGLLAEADAGARVTPS